jgi:uncharacterized membrane protein (DUF2068 family)
VAFFEAAKGVLVVASGAALIDIAHQGAQRTVEELVKHLHLNPASHFPRIFVDAAANLADGRLRLLAFGAGMYALVRFAEAYGLWCGKSWARFFGIATGAVYIPFEVWALLRRVTLIGVCALVFNVLVVGILVLWFGQSDTKAAT